MIVEQRRKLIEEWVQRDGSVSVEHLGKRLGVSTMTIWRDLKSMESEGRIKRVHGGAMKSQENNLSEAAFQNKKNLRSREKETIARYAVQSLVEPGEVLILEGGTTVANTVGYLNQPRLTVLTNGLDILNLASDARSHPTVMCCGGILRERSHTFVGPQAESFFKDFKAHKFFMSATGITLDEGLTDPNLLEIQVKRSMAACARQRILLIDSSKFGVHSLSSVLPLEEIDVLITDEGAPQDILNALAAMGIRVRVAQFS